MITVGWRPWFTRSDGSILILGDQQPCNQERPETPEPNLFGISPAISRQTAWLFDSTTNPSRADLFDTALLGEGARFKLLNVQTASALHLPSGGFEAAFPWLASLSRSASTGFQLVPKPANSPGREARPGNMTGWTAQAYAIKGEVRCADKSEPIVSLEASSACQGLRPCGAVEDTPCLQSLGNLRLRPAADFQQLAIDSATPEPAYLATLYATARLQDAQSKLVRRWSPAICFQGACVASSSGLSFRDDLYLPRENEFVRVLETSVTVGLTQFRNSSFTIARTAPGI
jgi:hypothetical protein